MAANLITHTLSTPATGRVIAFTAEPPNTAKCAARSHSLYPSGGVITPLRPHTKLVASLYLLPEHVLFTGEGRNMSAFDIHCGCTPQADGRSELDIFGYPFHDGLRIHCFSESFII